MVQNWIKEKAKDIYKRGLALSIYESFDVKRMILAQVKSIMLLLAFAICKHQQ